ncbi:MAG: YfhO family protein [Gemmatimonadaceae bacterium]
MTPHPVSASPAAAQNGVPAFAAARAIAVCALCTLILGYPAVRGQFLVNVISDQYIAGYAFREFGAHTLRTTGSFPLWNPYLLGGMPYVASMNGDIFYPTFLLRLVMPTDKAMTWAFIVHIVLAGVFTYHFARAWRIGFQAALVAALAYMMGGPVSSYVSAGHDGKLYVSALLPLFLWLITCGVRDGRPWAWGGIAVTVGLAALSPHPQLLQYMLLTGGSFALFLTLVTRHHATKATQAPRKHVGRLVSAAAAVGCGFLIGAVQYLPVAEYVPWSPRAGGKGYEFATSYSFPPEELINTVLPQFSGVLFRYWGRNGLHFHSEYLGVVVILLAALGLRALADEQRRTFARFWLGVWVVALLWALGSFTPFYQVIYALVPGTKFFRAPSTIFFLVAFATAIFAALGTERVLELRTSAGFLVGAAVFAGIVLALSISGALTGFASSLVEPERWEAVQANAPQVVAGAIRGFAATILACGIVLAAVRRRLRPSAAVTLLTALLVVDLWSVEREYWRFSAPAARLYGRDATIDYLTALDQPARVLAIPLREASVVHDPAFYDGLMVHGVRTMLGYHGNEIGRYDVLLGKEGGEPTQIGSPRVWRLLNVRYLLTNTDSVPIPNSRRVVGPTTDAAGSTVYLHELPGSNPVAWVTPVIVKASDDAVLATLRDPRFDPGLAALFDSGAAVTGQTVHALPAPTGVLARATRYDPGRITIDLDRPAPEGSALVVSENFYPGWKATADGRPVAVGRADYTLLGVPLPPGARSVDLHFESVAYARGKAITLAACLLAILALALGAAADRRTRHG